MEKKKSYSKSSGSGGSRFSKGDRPRAGAGRGDAKPRRFDKEDGERKPFRSREDGDKKPFRKREDGDRKPFRSREDGDKKPFRKREDGDRKPFRSREDGDKKPFRKREDGDRKPFRKREDGDRKPFRSREDGDRKPFRSREDGDRKPFRKREDGDRKPFRSREDGDRKPFRSREDGDRKPFRSREDGDRKPFRSREDGDRKPFRSREDGDRKPRFDRPERSDRPERKRNDRKPTDLRGFGERKKPFDDKKPLRKERFETRSFDPNLKGKKLSFDPGRKANSLIYGFHAVKQAFLNPARKVNALYLSANAMEDFEAVIRLATEAGLERPEQRVMLKEDMDMMLPEHAVHQGIIVDVAPLPEVSLKEIAATAVDNDVIVVLDQVTDPHNVGAILRSAAAFGAKAIVVQSRHAPDVTGVLAKTASGALDVVPIIYETNISRTLENLKEFDFWSVGLAEEGEQVIGEIDRSRKLVLVLGAEGDGLRRLVADKCDYLVKLPTIEPIGSLNVSNAAAVALYALKA